MPIRLATSEDTKQILDIYSNYIDTNITFEYSLPSMEEFEKRIKNIIEVYP
ncbi:GNAT family N-acetyltransferase, partial [Brachyspira pilosicoli]|uniref:GNAT family N-acetyltransferase n=1 Tax=Brachyspira pilosicoli TaxID=52584 RepID=UPI001CA4AAF5